MSDRSLIEDAGVGLSKAAGILDEALAGAEDGEIYAESVRSESFLFDDGILKGVNLQELGKAAQTALSSKSVSLGAFSNNSQTRFNALNAGYIAE